jgi:hypothetical protein
LKLFVIICVSLFIISPKGNCQTNSEIYFFGDTIPFSKLVLLDSFPSTKLREQEIIKFYESHNLPNYKSLVEVIVAYKKKYSLDDWLYYQLIRRTAETICPKKKNFDYYTFLKWYLLLQSGYNAQLAFVNEKLLLYVQSNDNIYDIPLFELEGKQYVCLNIHDFAKINFKETELKRINIDAPNAVKSFSYKINTIPNFKEKHEKQKDLFFSYHKRMNCINITIDEQMEILFNNYPSVDFDIYFNIPVSLKTYNSIIPQLRKKTKKMSQQKGIDYLMNFTRNAFLFETDQKNFGAEKRLSPEQTLMNSYSDCDDRVALLYYLVKEIYNIPMLVILYPNHVVLAVSLKKNKGTTLQYKNVTFTFCEPTPQAINLPLGQLMPAYTNKPYKIAFEYFP